MMCNALSVLCCTVPMPLSRLLMKQGSDQSDALNMMVA